MDFTEVSTRGTSSWDFYLRRCRPDAFTISDLFPFDLGQHESGHQRLGQCDNNDDDFATTSLFKPELSIRQDSAGMHKTAATECLMEVRPRLRRLDASVALLDDLFGDHGKMPDWLLISGAKSMWCLSSRSSNW